MRIDRRFNGPPTSAHGGAACGALASAVSSSSATVRLTAPIPLDTELTAAGSSDGWTEIEGPDGVVGRVTEWDVPDDLGPLPLVDQKHIDEGRRWWNEHVRPAHAFPTCFGCGHDRPPGDGLFLYSGWSAGTDLVADTWTPGPGETDDFWVWTAVDCPSGFGTIADSELAPALQPMVLGELSLTIRERPEVGIEYQVVARSAGSDGRKRRSDVALVAPDGRNVARGRSTWIVLKEPTS